jgi:ABC-2 type transport system permease protein
MTWLKIKKYGVVMKTSLQSNMAYSSNFLFGIFFYAFIIFIFMQLWNTIYGKGSTISGYSLNQMIWYCIFTEMIVMSGGNVFNELNTDIKGGNIAYLMNKPYHYIIYQLSNSMGLTAVKIIINAAAGIAMGLIYVGPLKGFELQNIPAVILSILLGILLNFFTLTSLGLTAFWLEENSAVFWIYQKLILILGTFMPVEFLPVWMQKITLVLPFSYITYGPAKLAVDFSMERFFRIIPIQAAYLALFILISMAVYRKGVKILNVNGG